MNIFKTKKPQDLSIAGGEAWDIGFEYLEANGGYKDVYFLSLYCYSKSADIIIDGYAQLSEEELTVEHENNKDKTNTKKNPIITLILEAQIHQRAYAQKLGFTPYDEARIEKTEAKPNNAFAQKYNPKSMNVA